MRCLWAWIRNTMAMVGAFLVYGGVSTSDYYVLELGQKEPISVWQTILVGLILMVPAVIHLIYKEIKEKIQ